MEWHNENYRENKFNREIKKTTQTSTKITFSTNS